MDQMITILEEFDHSWVSYEQIYVLELMLIEADARLFITEAIESEKELSQIEKKEKSRGRIVVDTVEQSSMRAKLVKSLGKINSVANPEGFPRWRTPVP